MSDVYYVYAYLRADRTPYYIGKGKGNRITGHHNVPIPKDDDRRVIVKESLSETDALKLEVELISKYGRKDNGTGILRNLTDGGEGTSGWVPPQEYRDKSSEFRRGKTYEELMGEDTARKVKKHKSTMMTGNTPGNKGKTYEEMYGKERATELKEFYKERFSGEGNPMFGSGPSKEQIERKRQEKLNAEKIQCEHCDEQVDPMNYGRWHGDKCKSIVPRPPRMKLLCDECKKLFAYNTIGQHQKKCKG